MKPTIRAAAFLCLLGLLLLCSLSACRNRDFVPAEPPADADGGNALPADFQCWVRTDDGQEHALPFATASEVFEEVKRVYEKSESVEGFADKDGSIRLVFCTGGTAPEIVIPAYQLPNATLYGVYTLFPDDTGRYGENVVTAHVHSFRLKDGSYERIVELVTGEN